MPMLIDRRSFFDRALALGGASLFSSRLAARQRSDADSFPWGQTRESLRARFDDLRRHFVFEYYPWYGNEPFNHWQQWGRVPPADLAGSSMPLLGAYDSRAIAVLEQHARWIADSGVGVVDLSWWGVGSYTDRATSIVMDVMHAHDLKVTFHLEPYGPERAEQLFADVRYLLREYGEKRGWDCFYFNRRDDGREGPVFKLFATTVPSHYIDCHGVRQPVAEFVEDSRWRWATARVHAEFRSTHPDLLILSGDSWHPERVAAAGFNGFANYDPTTATSAWLEAALGASRRGMVFSFNVNPGFDLIERVRSQQDLVPGECYTPVPFFPTTFHLNWDRADDRERAAGLADARIIETFEQNLWLQTHPWLGNVNAGFFLTYITSFNEWHEGTQFEPMRAHADLTQSEQKVGYHNSEDGFYRLRRLAELVDRLGA